MVTEIRIIIVIKLLSPKNQTIPHFHVPVSVGFEGGGGPPLDFVSILTFEDPPLPFLLPLAPALLLGPAALLLKLLAALGGLFTGIVVL